MNLFDMRSHFVSGVLAHFSSGVDNRIPPAMRHVYTLYLGIPADSS